MCDFYGGRGVHILYMFRKRIHSRFFFLSRYELLRCDWRGLVSQCYRWNIVYYQYISRNWKKWWFLNIIILLVNRSKPIQNYQNKLLWDGLGCPNAFWVCNATMSTLWDFNTTISAPLRFIKPFTIYFSIYFRDWFPERARAADCAAVARALVLYF